MVITPTRVLLVVRPMLNVPTENDDKKEKEEEAEDATSLTAKVHAKFFKDVLRSYNVELKE